MTGRKCVLMDLDGSTPIDSITVARSLVDLIQHNPDVHWVMVTGRSYASAIATEYGKLLCGNSLHVFDGGAMIATLEGLVLHRSVMSKSDIERLHVHLQADFGSYVFGSSGTGSGFVCSTDTSIEFPQVSRFTESLSTFMHWALSESVQKISVSGIDPAGIPEQLNHCKSGPVLDFLPPGISKASGVQNVLSMLAIRPQEAAFVFNDQNDLAVIEDPSLRGIYLIKVGEELPQIPAHARVNTPNDVSTLLSDWLSINRPERAR